MSDSHNEAFLIDNEAVFDFLHLDTLVKRFMNLKISSFDHQFGYAKEE